MGDLYLAHHGILGMKWGIRRYQNPDGSLTEEGKRRLQKYNNRNAIEGARNKYYASKTDNVNKAASAARSITGQARKNMSDRQRQEDEAEKQKIRDSIDLSNMTDEELRSAINRLQMEKQYKDLSMSEVRQSPEVQQGRDRIGRILDNMDTALAVGASAVALAGAIASLVGADFDNDEKPKKNDGDKKKEEKKDSGSSESKDSSQSSSSSSESKKPFSYRAGQAARSAINAYNAYSERKERQQSIDSAVERALERSRAGYEPAERTERLPGTYGIDPFTDERGTPYGSGPIYARGYPKKRNGR